MVKEKGVCFFHCLIGHKFKKLWRFVEKRLGLRGMEGGGTGERLEKFHTLCSKYILPYDSYVTSQVNKNYNTLILPNTCTIDPHLLTLINISNQVPFPLLSSSTSVILSSNSPSPSTYNPPVSLPSTKPYLKTPRLSLSKVPPQLFRLRCHLL